MWASSQSWRLFYSYRLFVQNLENLVSWADSAENYNKAYEATVGANTSAESAAQPSAGGTLNLPNTNISGASRTGGDAFLRETADFREYLGTLPVAEAQIALLGMQVFMGPAKAAVSLAGNVLINAMFGDKIDAIKDNAAVGMTASLRDEDKKDVQEEHDYAKQQYAAGEDGYLDGDGGVLASRFLIDLAAGEIGSLTRKVAGKAVGVVSGGQQGAKGNSVAEALTGVTQKQLDKKFKHASDFGVVTTKKNPETLAQYESAIKTHMASTSTTQQGTYGFVKDSKVFFNSTTNNAVVLDASGDFVTGFKLSPGTQQFDNFIKNGVLR